MRTQGEGVQKSAKFCGRPSREIIRPSEFKSKLMDYIWTHLVTIENKFDEELHESYD